MMRLPRHLHLGRLLGIVGITLSAFAIDAAAVDAPVRAEVSGARVRLGDVLPTVAPELASVDLGASPQPGAERVLTRDELVLAIASARGAVPRRLPGVVRITRRCCATRGGATALR